MSKEKNKVPARNESVALEWRSKGHGTQDSEGITLETVERHARSTPAGNQPNLLIHGDNQRAMLGLLAQGWEGKIDFIYIDPPFWTGDDYYLNGDSCNEGNGSLAYTDKWAGGIDSYLDMIHPRLVVARRLLKDTGSIFVHLDWHVSHYVKLLLDEIFGRQNLRNEIIWYYGGPSPVKSSFPRKHDVIFFYSKTAGYYFKPQYSPIKQYLLGRARKDPDGRLWVDQNVGKITERKFNELASEGRVFKTKTGRYRRKQYLDEMDGDMVDDVWEIPIINSQANERLGYPTQKPEALLERIIACASRPGDVIADFFSGSGTSLVVAEKMGRSWVGVDASEIAIQVARARLVNDTNATFSLLKCQTWLDDRSFQKGNGL